MKRDAGEERTESGILISSEQTNTGVVVAVGDAEMFTDNKSRIIPGAKIYF